ncbi:MAG TPA: 3-hydroxyacyl-CoA dehydrogenase [Streptosporangiaceae bacterium]|nr:3-hydroxyacyl-CoA dehydrogenase [Streptosporangiaceae bacterium]
MPILIVHAKDEPLASYEPRVAEDAHELSPQAGDGDGVEVRAGGAVGCGPRCRWPRLGEVERDKLDGELLDSQLNDLLWWNARPPWGRGIRLTVRRDQAMRAEDVRRVLVIGSGTMGLQIALQAAMHGYHVVLHDTEPAALDAARRRLRGYGEAPLAAGLIDADRLERALASIECPADPVAAAADVDLVNESVPEDPVLKGRVLGQFNELCPQRAVFTTNTSTLLPSMFAAATGRPDRFAALHFHTPVWSSNVVDVMPHPGTSAQTIELLLAFAPRIGQIPIRLRKESFGYVFNALYTAINREALTLAANGIASVEDVDRAWIGIMKMPIGPFGMLDRVGLDTVWQITDYWARQTGDPQTRTNAGFIRSYVDRGRLGVKSGGGFYQYPSPAYEAPEFLASGAGT